MAVDDGKERVLCVSSELLWDALRDPRLTRFQGFRPFNHKLLAGATVRSLSRALPDFHDRTKYLERNPRLKQLIPYAYLESQGKVWVYKRAPKGGDERLQRKASVGVGGHVNPEDQGACLSDTLLNGLRRELTEEVEIDCGLEINPVGLLNDEADEVGRVHLGVIYRVLLARLDVQPAAPELRALGWRDAEGLRAVTDNGQEWEGWSRILIDQLLAPPAPVPA